MDSNGKTATAHTRITIIYILGYGRSGSTITDILLNNHPAIASVGALNNLYRWISDQGQCACGQTVLACPFWSEIAVAHLGNPMDDPQLKARNTARSETQNAVERLARFPALTLRVVSRRQTAAYREQANDLFSRIASLTGKHIIVDSSKSTRDCTGRALALHRYADVTVKAIHLVRDGRGVAWSAMKNAGSFERVRRTESRPYNFMRTTLSWLLTNVLASASGRILGKKNYMVLRYEDLCASPERELARIESFVEVDMSPVRLLLAQGGELQAGHNLGGNRLRFSRLIRFNPDEEWKSKMPRAYSLIFWILAGPLARTFGYKWSDVN